ncbi:N-terminal nucleophile aminohydrolase [Hypomontagnella monticulosa]|nr:N-terminal nucleophile aminohydrolase [Hypomontagnella monticulosa]
MDAEFQDDDMGQQEEGDANDDNIDGLPRVAKRRRSPSSEGSNIPPVDGAGEGWGKRRKFPVSAVFIHAGAGYHSTANERFHLEACSEAARLSIKLLRSGRSAIDAVEAAIKVLENNEITNSGYGSNLSIDGTVECDATLVDHFGRSGACGAVPNIQNPITLAKTILRRSNEPLSLRRVPPNLLIGDGAKLFARETGIPVVPNEWLVSRNARDRFVRWREDMKRAESQDARTPVPAAYDQLAKSGYSEEVRQSTHKDHATAILTGTWNEGQPDSPAVTGGHSPSVSPLSESGTAPIRGQSPTPQVLSKTSVERDPLRFLGPPSPSAPTHTSKTATTPTSGCPSYFPTFRSGSAKLAACRTPPPKRTVGNDGTNSSVTASSPPLLAKDVPNVTDTSYFDNVECAIDIDGDKPDADNITDTVGAIAIDQLGRIAAGSSSGGIGMKHRGRIGPAALVGIGTAVIPADESHHDGIAVAAVTSGTGEHMATTMASQKCAERIFQGTRRGPGGKDVVEEDECQILEGFIINDFLDHPGVKNSSSAGAIGVMAVKKSPAGYYLYFAHNTDSFALASMGSNDRDPSCVMSRVVEGRASNVAQGARKIRV